MGLLSRIWEQIVNNTCGANCAKSPKSRSLRMESLEDRALLSVTTLSADTGGTGSYYR